MNADVDHFYFDGKHYDAKSSISDLPFWMSQAKRFGGPILELAVGTGRIAIPLAKEGYEVTGIDASKSMLERAEKKLSEEQLPIRLIKADIRAFDIGSDFSLVIIPANSIVHLHSVDDFRALLQCVRKHLRPRGTFIIDTHNPDLAYLQHDDRASPSVREYPDPSGDGAVEVRTTHKYDLATQINTISMRYTLPDGSDEIVDTIRARLHFPEELVALLVCNGFSVDERFGDYDGSPFGAGSAKQILICSAP